MHGRVAESAPQRVSLICRARRSYTARDLESHYVRCGHRISAEESGRVLGRIDAKYERNPMVGGVERRRRLQCIRKRRHWETRGMYPETGQLLMEQYVRRARGVR